MTRRTYRAWKCRMGVHRWDAPCTMAACKDCLLTRIPKQYPVDHIVYRPYKGRRA